MIRKHAPLLAFCFIVQIVALSYIFGLRPQEPSNNAGKTPVIVSNERARQLLASADTIRVEVETVECFSPEGPSCRAGRTFVTWLKPQKLRPLINQLKLTRSEPSGWGTGYVPALYFDFYKGKYKEGEQVCSLSIGYSSLPYDFLSAPTSALDPKVRRGGLRRGIHPQTVRLLRQLVARHPEMQKALKEVGVSPRELKVSKLL